MLAPSRYLQGVSPLDRGTDVVVPRQPAPVIIMARWQDGSVSEEKGVARAWTTVAVEIALHSTKGSFQGVWVPVADVRRA